MSLSFDVPNQSYLLTGFESIIITGADAEKLLQGQLTINVNHINAEQFMVGAICNHQGRCIALFWVCRVENTFYLVLPKSNADNCLAHLKKYAVFYKVSIERNCQQLIVGTHRTSSSELPTASRPIANTNQQLALSLVNQNEIPNHLSSGEDWLYQLAEHGLCWVEGDASGLFLPHNLDLHLKGAVDFKKGCFTGQEVIARMQYKGKLKSHLHRLECDQSITARAGDKIVYEQENVGDLVCSITNSQQQSRLLVVLKDSALVHKNFHLSEKYEPILKLPENKSNYS